MTATNIFYNFVGFRYSPALSDGDTNVVHLCFLVCGVLPALVWIVFITDARY